MRRTAAPLALAFRERIGASTIGIIMGLLVLLMVAVVACDDPEPEQEGEPTVSSPGTTTVAEHVATPVRALAVEPTSAPLPTPTPTATPLPTLIPPPTSTPIPISIPTNTPSPTDEEYAVARLAETIPWFLDPPDNDHVEAVAVLSNIWLRDADFGNAVAKFPWLADGVDLEEYLFLRSLRSLVSADLDVTRIAVSVPWLGDEVTSDERMAFKALGSLMGIDLRLAESIVALPWFIDDIRRTEPLALQALTRISSTDLELAKRILRWPRFADDITMVESVALHALGEIALLEPELSSHWGEYAIDGTGDLRLHLLSSIFTFADEVEADLWKRLTGEPWFADGLDDEETAFVTVLGRTAKNYPQLYSDLLQNRFTQSRSVSLPLAGEVNVWVFQATPFASDDVSMSIEDTMRTAEEIMAVPFPTTDVILLLGESGFHVGSFMGLVSFTGEVPHVPHETAHYYFGHSFPGPTWFIEGGAEFVEALVTDQTGAESLGDREFSLRNGSYAFCIDELKIEDLWHLRDPEIDDASCDYHMGEYFFLNLYETMGQEAMSAAMKELSVSLLKSDSKVLESRLSDHGWEERIYRSFLRHTPADRRDEFLELYERLHGGPFVFQETRSHQDPPRS